MFDNYYKTVIYNRNTNKKDEAGFIIKDPDIEVYVREVIGTRLFNSSTDVTTATSGKEYQCPVELELGGLVNGREIVSVDASRDVFGRIQFYIIKTV